MNCQSFESIVNELARQQMMEANVREQALAHTLECGVCGLMLEDQRALTQKLRALTTEMNEMTAPAQIEDELLGAFRKHRFTPPRRPAIHDWRYWATAAAAVLLIVIGLAAMRPRQAPVTAGNRQSPPSLPAVTNHDYKPKASDQVKEPGPVPQPEKRLVNNRPKRHAPSLVRPSVPAGSRDEVDATAVQQEAVAANYGESEVATDFLPVGYTSPIDLQDGGQLMRVELPRSVLAGFGLPVNMERVNERVKADVLVGPDGQPRAIRFVQ